MPSGISHVNAQIACPHGAQAKVTPSQTRVKVSGNLVAVAADVTMVAGCTFQIPIGTGTKPSPCTKVQWSTPATRVKAMGKPILLQSSTGLCQSAEQAPQGKAVVVTQIRVKGT